MNQLPYLPLYVGEILAATITWEGEERALLLLLLAVAWTSGPLPADTRRLSKICGYELERFELLWPTVSGQFLRTDTGLVNERLEELREHAQDLKQKRSIAGLEGVAEKRRKAAHRASDKPNGQPIAPPSGQANASPSAAPIGQPSAEPSGQAFREGQGRSEIRSDHLHTEVGTQAALEAEIQQAYPPCNGGRKWLEALRSCSQQVEDGEATWPDLLECTLRYRDFVAAGGVSGPSHVLTPQNFFASADQLWRQPRELNRKPKSETELRLERERAELQELIEGRAARGLSHVREPKPIESPGVYRTFLNEAEKELHGRRPGGQVGFIVSEIAAAKTAARGSRP